MKKKLSYTIKECAKICQTSIWTLHRRIKEGHLVIFRAGGGRNFKVTRQELLRFIKENKLPVDLDFEMMDPVNILIVDDDTLITDSLNRYLSSRYKQNIKTFIATSGFRAGALMKEVAPDLVIIDIMLGDINGKEIIADLRSSLNNKPLKIIAISGYINDNEIQSVLDAGANMFLNKPFDLKKISDIVDGLIK